MSFYLNVLPQHPSKKGCQQFPPKNKHSSQSRKAYLFSKKRLLPVHVLAVLPSRDFQIRHWWLTWRRLWQTLDSTDSREIFSASVDMKKVWKGRFGARNFDPNCFGVDNIHASSAKLSLRLHVERP